MSSENNVDRFSTF